MYKAMPANFILEKREGSTASGTAFLRVLNILSAPGHGKNMCVSSRHHINQHFF